MTLLRPDLVAAKGLIAIPHGLAVIATLFRLFDRHRMRRLWWDDFWAFVALLMDIPLMIAFFLRPESGSGSAILPINSRVAICWIGLIMFPCVLWGSRLSIAASILRLCPPGSIWRRITFFTGILFGFMWSGLVIMRSYFCGRDSSWHSKPSVQCFFPKSVGTFTLVTDIVADVILIAIPVIMMWGVPMVKQLRRLFFAVFAASILTSLASIVFVTFLFGARGWGPGLSVIVTVTSHLEAAIALLVCNILVIVTYFYRVSHEGEDLETVADANTQEATRLGDTSLAAKTDMRDSSSDLESK
ncbi:hypothetical protein BDN71DRAFT_1450600 [Pleurotus eryngii]|uniref:Rhodopsin domain-containing protein n=1 Tax=Pleurotus eryngii TaxID=5323 RepID=A0A9P5ZV11_PLEER|nr:hypothetical protein BDN71DRAFT_1450600 [Pleurotus eryngii]